MAGKHGPEWIRCVQAGAGPSRAPSGLRTTACVGRWAAQPCRRGQLLQAWRRGMCSSDRSGRWASLPVCGQPLGNGSPGLRGEVAWVGSRLKTARSCTNSVAAIEAQQCQASMALREFALVAADAEAWALVPHGLTGDVCRCGPITGDRQGHVRSRSRGAGPAGRKHHKDRQAGESGWLFLLLRTFGPQPPHRRQPVQPGQGRRPPSAIHLCVAGLRTQKRRRPRPRQAGTAPRVQGDARRGTLGPLSALPRPSQRAPLSAGSERHLC
mmetsp:Transcript_27808/g.88386  ORF Transcript_27808/g.88386 Transcript_27808/m.88386 type:complete len:268 (+) Transcript_27808:58-861(+)